MVDLASILVGGAASRPDSITGLNPDFIRSLEAMLAGAPPEIQTALQITSGYRSPAVQQQLWNDALAKYGSPEAARKWVAPPGNSQHNHGYAVDLKFVNDAAKQWAHANAGQFGLAFPMGHEPWHVELAGVRGGGGTPHNHAPAAPTPAAGAPAMTAMAGGAGVPASPFAAAEPAPPAGLAALFMQNQLARQQQRREEREADEQARRAALFGGPLFG